MSAIYSPCRHAALIPQDAGSAKQFKKVDYEYVARSAALAKSSGVKYYGLVSATGANPHVWASDMALFHPLLYTKTKGLVGGCRMVVVPA